MQKSFKFFNRPIIGWISIVLFTIIWIPTMCFLFKDYAVHPETKFLLESIIILIVLWIFLTIVISIGAFKRIIINDIGITQTTLWFFKRRMPWDEIKEMRYVVVMGAESIVFSKELTTELSPFQAREQKGVIQLEPSKKTLIAIREFTDMEITGLAKEDEELIKSQKIKWI